MFNRVFNRLLADKRFNQAILAIERYDVEWDFGPLEFRDLKIVSVEAII
jgi:hypothetical protein